MSTNKTATSSPAQTVPTSWEYIPCVQYGFPGDKGPRRSPKLYPIFEPIPDEAATASPVYLISRRQYERQQRLDDYYQVKGATSIATEIQDECEADDRVLYPIHIESDEYHKVGPKRLITWFQKFVDTQLNIPFRSCTLYFSGNRSIHVHVPRFVSGEGSRNRLKDLAETFCADTDAELDCGLYSRKRMFRLPGVEHSDTGLCKVEIEPEWSHSHIVRQAGKAADTPNSYEAVLRTVFSKASPSNEGLHSDECAAGSFFRAIDSKVAVVEIEEDSYDIDVPVIEQSDYPDDPRTVPKWAQYNAKEFSPYALASGNGRSVAVIKMKDGAFARRGKRDGATMVPAYFHGARGCAGADYLKSDEHAPLQLSKPDYEKWKYEPGDHVVIIGGKSARSRIFSVAPRQAKAAGQKLREGGAGRTATLEYLDSEGYNIGSAGSTAESSSSAKAQSLPADEKSIWPARDSPQSEAEALQRQAEQQGIETLTHHERLKVGCRHLRQGWEPTWDWFRDQFGAEFKPDVTWRHLKGIVEADDFDEYDSVTVPPAPN